jgi:type VI secretion system protein ImpH
MENQVGPAADALEVLQRAGGARLDRRFLAALVGVVAQTAVGRRTAMARPRRDPQALWQLLEERSADMELFAAMRLIAGTYRELPTLGTARRVSEDPARFGQDVSLAFAPGPVARAEAPRGSRKGKLAQWAIGLFGPNGPLPNHLSEYALQRQRHERDFSMAAFADIFHHRTLSLLYRAWAINHPTVGLDRPADDRFGHMVAALCGLGMPALSGRDSVSDQTKWAHSGSFSRQVRNPEGLKELLNDYFGVSVQVVNWVGYWMRIPPDQQTRLGAEGGFGALGVESIAGACVWDVQTSFRIVVGPLSHGRYLDFLPSGQSLARMIALIKLYVGDALRFEIQLVLAHQEVPLSWLGNDVQLGWTSWLGVRVSDEDAVEYVATQ